MCVKLNCRQDVCEMVKQMDFTSCAYTKTYLYHEAYNALVLEKKMLLID